MKEPKDPAKWLARLTPHKVRVHVGDEIEIIPCGTFGTRNKWNRTVKMLDGLAWHQLDALDKKGELLGSFKRELEPEVDEDTMVNLAEALQGGGAAPRDLVLLAQVAQMTSTMLLQHTKVISIEHREATKDAMAIAMNTLGLVSQRLEGLEKAFGKMVQQTMHNARMAAQLAAGSGEDGLESDGPFADMIRLWLAKQEAKEAAEQQQQQQRPKNGANGANGASHG